MRRHFKIMAFMVLVILAAPVRAAERPIQYGVARPLPVVASFSILGDMVKTIGGDLVEVRTLVASDGDAHVYIPTPADIKAVQAAPLVIVNGLGFDGWLEPVVKARDFTGRLVTASDGVEALTMEEERVSGRGHSHAAVSDPHAWQNVGNARLYASNIANALEKALPDHARVLKERARAYDEQLMELDRAIHRAVGDLAARQRKIITSHDAFGYFGAAYGIEIHAAAGLSTEDEPSAREIAALVEQIKGEGVRAVFLENMSNPRLLTQIAKDTGIELGGVLYADSLSGEAPTYLGMMRRNTATLVAGMRKNAAR